MTIEALPKMAVLVGGPMGGETIAWLTDVYELKRPAPSGTLALCSAAPEPDEIRIQTGIYRRSIDNPRWMVWEGWK